MSCVIEGCRSHTGRKENSQERLSFHRFPKNEDIKREWLRRIRRPNWKWNKRSHICSKHFTPDSFEPNINPKLRRLKADALPSLCLSDTNALERIRVLRDIGNAHGEASSSRAESHINIGFQSKCTPSYATPLTSSSSMVSSSLPGAMYSAILSCSTSSSSSALDSTSTLYPMSSSDPSDLGPTTMSHPTLSPGPEDLDPKITSYPTSSSCPAVFKPLHALSPDSPRPMMDICTVHKGHIEKLEKEVARLQNLAKRRLLKINSLRQRTRRLNKKNEDINLRLIDILKQEKIEKEHLLMLECVKNNKVIERYLSKAKGDKSREYCAELKKFAVTLHYLSPKAYSFIREELNDVLPHPKTIAKWYQSINCEPGFTKEAMDAIKQRVAQNNGKPLYGALCIDEMAIRKLVEWDGRNYFGYANVGCELDSDDVPLAKEALTFMLTSLNDTWKIPVGYFFLHSITARQKALLVEQCLTLLKECGVIVVSLTYDGAATNKAMCKYLGCETQRVNSFKHEDQIVCLWPDPCHNIKLVRNAFFDRKLLVDNQGLKISWHHVELLNKIQNEERLHLGNKLKDEHVNFVKQKMKVRLATQLMSQSVADALKFCKDLGIPGFEDCEGTIKFITMFNNLFDILNSRNMRAKGWKKAATSFNIQAIQNFFAYAETYIKGLRFYDDNTFVLDSNRSTGFAGFLTCMMSLLQLFNSYVGVENSVLKYICTYKLSQDHIELFFGAIRARCGFNNNPSARMYRAAYKRLLVHAQFKQSAQGNCLPLEEIKILNYTPDKFTRTLNESTPHSRLIESAPTETEFDHDYIHDPTLLSEFTGHIVQYIAGFVVRSLKKKLICEMCIESLQTNNCNEPVFSLIKVKDRGGLIKPSTSTIKVCKTTEKVLREFEIRFGSKLLGLPKHMSQMISKVTAMLLRTDIFAELFEHSFENTISDNHRTLLIKSIIQTYLNIRIHYMTKNIVESKDKVRSLLTKTVIFKGQ